MKYHFLSSNHMGFEPQVVDVLNAMFSRNLKPQNEDEEFDIKK